MYRVEFLNERGQVVEKRFDSAYECRTFVNKLRHSKKCKLLFVPSIAG